MERSDITTTLRAALYGRVSKLNNQNPAMQFLELREYCLRRKMGDRR